MTRSSILLLLAFVLSSAVACADGAAGDGTSGIEGRITIGPQCPVMQVGSPCPDVPFVASVRVVQDGDVVATGRSGEDGSFRIPVAPGEYVVEGVPPDENGIAVAQAQSHIVVTAGSYTRVDLTFDSGIR
jgi:hypothetical protein